jgi:hypothetical protein
LDLATSTGCTTNVLVPASVPFLRWIDTYGVSLKIQLQPVAATESLKPDSRVTFIRLIFLAGA